MWRVLVSFCFVSVVHAQTISVDLQDVRFRDFVHVVYGDMLKKGYVLDHDLLLDDNRLSVRLENATSKVVEDELLNLLEIKGYAVSGKGVVRVFKKREVSKVEDQEVFFYRPKFRSCQYFIDLASTLVDPRGFTVRRSVSNLQLSDVSSKSSGAVQLPETGLNSLPQKDSDVIVYSGTLKDVRRLESIIARLDVPVSELLVKAVIYEVQKTDKEGSALDLAFSILSSKVGVTLSGGADSKNSAYVKVHGLGLDLSAVYSALSSDDRFKLVSSPTVRVVSGGRARFSVGQEVPVLGGVAYDGVGKQVQSIQYKDAGVILDLTADVRGEVSDLKIDQQISSFVTTTTGVNTTPTLVKRQLSTSIQARDDDVLVLGGLNETSSKGANAGFSFLPSFLRSSSSEEKKTEIILMLQVQRI